MNLKAIIRGKWYETKLGVGQAVRVGGTHPPSVQVRVFAPIPRGVVTMTPRDVIREVPDPTENPQPSRPPVDPPTEGLKGLLP